MRIQFRILSQENTNSTFVELPAVLVFHRLDFLPALLPRSGRQLVRQLHVIYTQTQTEKSPKCVVNRCTHQLRKSPAVVKLRSASRRHFTVPRYRLSTFGRRSDAVKLISGSPRDLKVLNSI